MREVPLAGEVLRRRLETIARYKKDAESTPVYNTLSLKIDTGKAGDRSGIHWHVAGENQVRYASVDDEREEMIWVDVRRPDGGVKRYRNRSLAAAAEDPDGAAEGDRAGHKRKKSRSSEERTFDCIDCHNRATHIYEDPNDAVDRRIELGLVDRTLPFIKREALAAVTANYPNETAAMDRIAKHLHGFYEREYPEIALERRDAVEGAVKALQDLYKRNIHHQMNITWNTYPSLIGHSEGRRMFPVPQSRYGRRRGESGVERLHDVSLDPRLRVGGTVRFRSASGLRVRGFPDARVLVGRVLAVRGEVADRVGRVFSKGGSL